MSLQALSFRRSGSLALAFAIVFSLFQAVLLPVKAEAASGYKIIGYYPAWGAYGRNYQVYDIDATKVTHINYAFADICWNGIHGNPDPTGPNPQTWSCQDENGVINVPNGSIVMGDPWIDAQKSNPGDVWSDPLKGNFKQLIKLKQANPNLKTIISVGGWTWSNRFSDVAATAATRDNFANSAVNFLRKYQFDGVDLDWEYPVGGGLPGNSVRAEDKHNYTLLLQNIRQKLDAAGAADGKHYLLTIASGASPAYAQNTELAGIAAAVDWINIMTYDFNGGWQTISAHNAPLYYDPAAAAAGVPNASSFNVDAAVQGHLNAGVPAGKLVMGTPFYGRGWTGCGTANNGQYQACTGPSGGTWEAGSWDFSDLENNYINKNGYTRYWNNTAKVPYLYNPSNKTYISYDDVESMGYKTSFIKTKGLAGAMFWEFSGDRNKTLLNKLAADLPISGGGTDTTPPSVPGNLQSTGKTSSSVSLSWSASTDNVGVTGYVVIYGSGSLNVSGTSATVTGLAADTPYTFTVKAQDAAGNLSAASSAVTVTTNAPLGTGVVSGKTYKILNPNSGKALDVSNSGTADGTNVQIWNDNNSVAQQWQAIAGADGTFKFINPNSGKALDVSGSGTTDGTNVQIWTDNNSGAQKWQVIAGADGTYKLINPNSGKALDVNGAGTADGTNVQIWTDNNTGAQKWQFYELSVGGSDTTPPSAPANLASTGKTSGSVSLSWNASTDNVGVTGYTVTYGSTNVNAAGTTATITGLSAGTAYTFTVKARDAAGNVSAASNAVTVTTDTSTVQAWAPNIAYKVNDLVTYGGQMYYCIQAHTSQVGWEPPNVPALWGPK